MWPSFIIYFNPRVIGKEETETRLVNQLDPSSFNTRHKATEWKIVTYFIWRNLCSINLHFYSGSCPTFVSCLETKFGGLDKTLVGGTGRFGFLGFGCLEIDGCIMENTFNLQETLHKNRWIFLKNHIYMQYLNRLISPLWAAQTSLLFYW